MIDHRADPNPSPEQLAHFGAETLRAIAESRSVRSAGDWPLSAGIYAAVADELRPLLFQVAEMAEQEPDNLRLAAEYLHGLFEREPLRSSPFWEPQRAVLGLFQLCLTNALVRLEAISAADRTAQRPAFMAAAAAAVTEAFDPTYIPPSDPLQPEEEEAVTPTNEALPEITDALLLAQL